ncbi:hypothetical protein CsSME_00037294 [Camellia sinensis var. sinensis]
MVVKNENSSNEKPLDLFLKIGLDERTAKNTVANNKVTANLTAVIHEAAVTDGCDRAIGNFLYTVATKFPANALVHRPALLQYIVSSKIKAPAQLEAAFSFFATTGSENFKINEFEEACGVGVEVSVEDIEHTVTEIFEEHKNVILEQRYRTNVGELFGHVRKRQPWADPKIVKLQMMKSLLKRRKRSLLKLRNVLLRWIPHQNHLKKNSIHFQYSLHQRKTIRYILKYFSVIALC